MADRFLSPLRYPGGKARMAPYLARLIAMQPVRPTAYAEPFAGGAGAALRLLVDGTVDRIYINDLAPGIAAFWRSVFMHTEELATMVETATVDLTHWYRARAICTSQVGYDDLSLGYATFFLNRCNRSGILGARPIGGLQQTGKWKIDARFNRANLAGRIRMLGEYRDRVVVSQLDAREFLDQTKDLGERLFLYVDPPYVEQGEDLYLDSLETKDHEQLAEQLKELISPWVLTYDVANFVSEDLYADLRTAKFGIAHTAQRQHIGSELAVFSKNLLVDSIQVLPRANATWLEPAISL